MWRWAVGVVFAVVVAVFGGVGLKSQPPAFVPGCPLPFTGDPSNPIDDKCGPEGDPGGSPEGRLQNTFKTNLCATGTKIEVTDVTFRALQLSAQALKNQGALRFGSPQAPPLVNQRPLLSDLHITNPAGDSVGEGKLVRMVAYLLHASFSAGESVNCNSSGNLIVPARHANEDIHVYLSKTKPHRPTSDADKMKMDCKSMTAEIIPHFRPDDFEKIAQFHDTQGGAKAFDRIAAAKLNRPMRFTGQMFFDGAHTPCSSENDTTHTPRRFSNWEIHPLYALHVCKFAAKAKCRVDHEDDWRTFKDWMDSVEEPEE